MINFICNKNRLIKLMLPYLDLQLSLVGLKPTIQVPNFVMIIIINTYLTTMISAFGFTCCFFTFNEYITWTRVNTHFVFQATNFHRQRKCIGTGLKIECFDSKVDTINLSFQLMVSEFIQALWVSKMFSNELDVMCQSWFDFVFDMIFWS